MNIQAFFKTVEGLNIKIKGIFLGISVLVVVSGYSFFQKLLTEESGSKRSEEVFIPVNEVLKPDESLITIKVSNSSKYILDSINSAAYVDVLVKIGTVKSKIIARNARLIKINREKSETDGENMYIISLIVDKKSAQMILDFEPDGSFSIIVHSEKEGNEEGNYAFTDELEIIEERGEEND